MLDQGLEVCVGDKLIPYAERILVAENFPDYASRDMDPHNTWSSEERAKFSDEANSFRETSCLNKGQWSGNEGQWVFQHNLFVRDIGIFVVHDRQVEELGKDKVDYWKERGRLKVYVEQLQEKLRDGEEKRGVRFSSDGSIRFAPWNTLKCMKGNNDYFNIWHPPTRDCPHTEIERRTIGAAEIPYDGFMIASFGVLGAEILTEIVKRTTGKFLDYWIIHSQGLVREEKFTLGVQGYDWHSFYNLSFKRNFIGSAAAKSRKD